MKKCLERQLLAREVKSCSLVSRSLGFGLRGKPYLQCQATKRIASQSLQSIIESRPVISQEPVLILDKLNLNTWPRSIIVSGFASV
jgi:hypothetical protein